jgi:hypothetical protein
MSYSPLDICCTVEAFTPNCSAILRTPGLPGARSAKRGSRPRTRRRPAMGEHTSAGRLLSKPFCASTKFMNKSIASKKKRGRGRPKTTGTGVQVVVRLHNPMLTGIDRLRCTQEDEPTRAEAIRRIVYQELKEEVRAFLED